jgi:hypothetical protein
MAHFARFRYSVLALLCGCAGASSNSDAVRSFVVEPDAYCRGAPAALTDSAAVRLSTLIRAQASVAEKAQGVRAALPDADTFEELEASACLLQIRYMSYHPAYISRDQFHAFVDSVAPAVLAEGATPEDRDFQKRVPRPVNPEDGATFDVYPRRTSVSWEPVPGATYYLLDVEVMTTIEESRQGRTVSSWRGWVPVAGTHLRQRFMEASGTFDFIGASRGRWRVRAINARGIASRASEWRGFEYRM